jgi:hypothetical protein
VARDRRHALLGKAIQRLALKEIVERASLAALLAACAMTRVPA